MPYLTIELRKWGAIAIKLNRFRGPEFHCIAVLAKDYNNTLALSISEYAIIYGALTKDQIADLSRQAGWIDLNGGPHLGLGGEQGYLIGKYGFVEHEPALKKLLDILGPKFKFYRK